MSLVPDPQQTVEANDHLVVIGERQQLSELAAEAHERTDSP